MITTCAPAQYERLKSLGADHCFDYHLSQTGDQIRRLTENRLRFAWDTIANENSARMCADALSTDPGARYGTTNPMKSPRADVESTAVVMYTMMGEAFKYGTTNYPACRDDFEFAKRFMTLTESLLDLVRAIWAPNELVSLMSI